MTYRKLSLLRVLISILIVLGSGYYFYSQIHTIQEYREVLNYKPWFASYVDVTSKPLYAFEQLNATGTYDVVLAFIVASKTDDCTPTWGTYFTMDEAATALNLDRRIARLQQQGGKIAISFGGALNDELSFKCKDEDALYQAYKSVIERYKVNTIDLDIENANLNDNESIERRAKVISKLQKDQRSEQRNLAVWLTLPVAPQGLTKASTDLISIMLKNEVDIAGVNVMVMDYGNSISKGQSMYEASKQALNETHRQLGILYKQSGITLSDKTLWTKIGATPMIGQNDFVDEIFTIDDAKNLNKFVVETGIGRMSMWSANRDVPCGENYVDTKVVSDSCSGVETKKLNFAQTLKNGFDGNLEQNASILTVDEPLSNVVIVDDPEKSPYQIWKDTGAYPKGVKVVWHGNVYEAKWWTKNDLPDNPVLQSWETPWLLIGPVLPNEKPIKQPTLPAGVYPNWRGSIEYEGGDIVLFEGVPFQAKWWNQGQSPAASAANSDSSPWLPLSQAQIEEVRKRLGLSTEE